VTNVKTDWHDDAGAPVTRSYVCPTDEQRHEWLGPEIPSFLALAERQQLGGKCVVAFIASVVRGLIQLGWEDGLEISASNELVGRRVAAAGTVRWTSAPRNAASAAKWQHLRAEADMSGI
jgi:hypothetical protein